MKCPKLTSPFSIYIFIENVKYCNSNRNNNNNDNRNNNRNRNRNNRNRNRNRNSVSYGMLSHTWSGYGMVWYII